MYLSRVQGGDGATHQKRHTDRRTSLEYRKETGRESTSLEYRKETGRLRQTDKSHDRRTSLECREERLPLAREPCALLGGELGPESGLLPHTPVSTAGHTGDGNGLQTEQSLVIMVRRTSTN